MTGRPPTPDRPSRRHDLPGLLLVTAVLPFPGSAGQQQRVRNKLLAFRERFRVTVVTFAAAAARAEVERQLAEWADRAVVLPSRYHRHPLLRRALAALGTLWAWATGLKRSNFVVGHLELTEKRLDRALEELLAAGEPPPVVAVYEYWHAVGSVPALRRRGIPAVLDMHDLLWRSRERQLAALRWLPGWLRRRWVGQYRRREEAAWEEFDALVSINRDEDAHARRRLPGTTIFYAPMGTDMERWRRPAGGAPARPPRLAYYGGLASPHNRADALHVAREVMPRLWADHPEAELWIVGSSPPPELRAVAQGERRVTVTGFVDDAPALLATMTAVLCPWTGTYGFRSRLVEVMALGVPVVASSDAVAGMELAEGRGLFLAEDAPEMARLARHFLADPERAARAGADARRAVEERYSFDATYGRLARELAAWLGERPDDPETATGTEGAP